jgi:hypothetical protein
MGPQSCVVTRRECASDIDQCGHRVAALRRGSGTLAPSIRRLAARWPLRIPAARAISRLGQGQLCNDSTVDERNAAQAVELVRALCDQLHQMTRQLARLECQSVTGTNGRASAIRSEAAALRRDINKAQLHIDRLERRYPNGNGHAQPRLPEQRGRGTRQTGPVVQTAC